MRCITKALVKDLKFGFLLSCSFLKIDLREQKSMKSRCIPNNLSILPRTIFLIAILFMNGCGQGTPQKEIRVTSPVGKIGICDNCKQKIASVSPENLITHNAIQYLVCNEKCTNELKVKLANQ